MVRSSKWHHAQFYDMMAMVDTSVLFQLFFTFSSNETLEFKWSDVSNMTMFLKYLGEIFILNFCPIECAHLFHTRVCTFMTN